MNTDIHGEDQLLQATFGEPLRDALGWGSIYAHNEETCRQNGTLGRAHEREAVLVRDLQAAVERINLDLLRRNCLGACRTTPHVCGKRFFGWNFPVFSPVMA